jgi:predicted transcriptional regulator
LWASHGAGDQKCPVQDRQVEVSRVTVVQKLSYAEAMKKVEEDGSMGRDPEKSGVSSRSVPVQRDRPTSEMCFIKMGVFAFIAMVINFTAGTESKSQKIDVVVAAAERYLGVRYLHQKNYRVC